MAEAEGAENIRTNDIFVWNHVTSSPLQATGLPASTTGVSMSTGVNSTQSVLHTGVLVRLLPRIYNDMIERVGESKALKDIQMMLGWTARESTPEKVVEKRGIDWGQSIDPARPLRWMRRNPESARGLIPP